MTAHVGRILLLIIALTGGIVGSQAPEFAQQYRQRLGGALAELRIIMADFDRDASRNGLSREAALGQYAISGDPFLQDRGVSMARTAARLAALEEEDRRIDDLPASARPLALLTGGDRAVLAGAWEVFQPAVPVTLAGLIWFGVGFAIAWVLGLVPRKAALAARRLAKKPAR